MVDHREEPLFALAAGFTMLGICCLVFRASSGRWLAYYSARWRLKGVPHKPQPWERLTVGVGVAYLVLAIVFVVLGLVIGEAIR